MFQCIDPVLIEAHIGDLSIFERVGAVFLVQSAGWRREFARATGNFDTRDLANLMHKMKGSCQTVAAMDLAGAFAQAEKDLPNLSLKGWAIRYTMLDASLAQLEDEIKSIIAHPQMAAQPVP